MAMGTHKECMADEVFVGNVTTTDETSDLKDLSYRFGVIAYDIDGNILSDFYKPLFVKKSSHAEWDRRMTNASKKARYGNEE